MPDRRRQRQQRVRHDAGGSQNSVGASNRDPEPEKPAPQHSQHSQQRPPRRQGSGVAYAEPKQYESVTIMPDKEVSEPQKYQRKGVLSNWSRYEEIPTDQLEEGEDYMIGEDFSEILEQQGSNGSGYLRLKGESHWEDPEASLLTSHGLGALHVADLVAAIKTLPLYTQLNIPEEILPVSVLEYYTHLAEDNKKLYKPSQDYKDCSEIHEKLLESLKISEAEPLFLSNEEAEEEEEIKPSAKTAVDVALSLEETLTPESQDVDINSLMMREPSVDNEVAESHEPSPAKSVSPPPVSSQPNVVANSKKGAKDGSKPAKVSQPTNISQSQSKQNVVVANSQSAARVESKAAEVCEPTNVQRKKSPKIVDVASPPAVKVSQQPQPQARELSNASENQHKGPAKFDFGLSKANTATTKKAKDNVSSTDLDAISDPLKVQESEKDEASGPGVDLDAPVEHSKPVIVPKSETEDLEDWLDSVLDD